MGLNVRDIQLRFFIVLQVSVENSYTFMQTHPRLSSALSVFFIMYIFLSCIYNLLVFLSPFLVCTAIFVRIFWSSEQTHIRCVEKKGEEEMVEAKNLPKMLKNERRGMLYKYPSQNATSRRRNFTGKKLDVYGDLEQKAKDLSAVFRNEFTKKNTEIRRTKFFEKEMNSLDYKLSAKKLEAPTKQTLFSEPSMLDLVTCRASCGGKEKTIGNMEDEKKAQDDSNKTVELREDDRKNRMDLGICEMESNKRLESLIARRRARKQLKLQLENGLIDMKSVTPSQIEPLFITRINPFDSPKGFDGIEMPGSAPSALRSPFDIPYDPFEEKPNLTGDGFDKEFTSEQKDMPLEPRQDLDAKEDKLANPSNRRLSGKGNHDRPEQLISIEGSKSEQAPSPLSEGDETTHKDEGKCKIDMASMKGDEVGNADAINSMLDHASGPNLIPTITNVERVIVSEKLGPSALKPEERVLDFPISSTNATNINDSLYESLSTPVDKNEENMFFTNRNIYHTPSCSLASDLQVEVSEVGSPTLAVDESHETITTTNGEFVVYDEDVDKDVTSRNEDMWGASLHSREARGFSEQDILEASNWRDIASSPIPLQNKAEENGVDVSSMSSRSDMLKDTSTHTMSSDHNIFGEVKDFVRETDAPQPSHSPVVLSRWKRLVRLMDTHVNHLPHEMLSEKPEERCNQTENLINKTQVINDVNSLATTEQDNTQDLRSNEESGASVMRHEAADEASTNSSSSLSSPRSVLPIPHKTIDDQVSSSTYDQEIHLGVQQSDMEGVAQETVNGEGPLDSMPQNIQPPMDDPNVESHNGDLGHSQERTYPLENSFQEPHMSNNMNDTKDCNKEDQQLKNDENSEDKFAPLSSQDASAEPHKLVEMMTSEDMNEKSRELLDNKVPLISLILESSSGIHRENEEKSQALVRQEASMEPFNNAEATDTSSAKDFEGKHNYLNKNEAILSSCKSVAESDKLIEIHSLEEVNYLQSESKQVVKDHMEKEQWDKGDISEDPPLPMVTEVTNVEEALGEFDKMNKNEDTDQELHKSNQTMVLSEPTRESDKVSNITHMNDT